MGGMNEEQAWIKHFGGLMPAIPEGQRIEVRYRDGGREFTRDVTKFRWDHKGTTGDIVAYRLVDTAPCAIDDIPTRGREAEHKPRPPSLPKAGRKHKHNHYFKDVSRLDYVDVYRVLHLYEVTDQAIGHAIKKLLVAGGRGAGKDIRQDIKEAIDSLQRWQDMQEEDNTDAA